MSSESPAVSARNVSKRYRIADAAARPSTLREAIGMRVRHPLRRQQHSTFQALDDVSFEVAPGEVVGIIGRNGAGKSTLLKVLSRITEPTQGEIVLRGSCGSLLEVGTGFHPELTGRENILLNGTILGLTRRQIAKRFDEIVGFAGVDRFLETPVKRYSSGMYVRLAFSVAAHLEPDILLIDEVLAVGDAEFQAKCLGRMEEMSREGRTILFVSHSMPAVLRLCQRAILLDRGTIVADDVPSAVVGRYVSPDASTAARTWDDWGSAPGDDVVRLKSVRVIGAEGRVADEVDIEAPFQVRLEWWQLDPASRVTPHLHFRNDQDILLFISLGEPVTPAPGAQPGQVMSSTCHIPGNLLSEGQLFLLAGISTLSPPADHVMEADVVSFTVIDRLSGDSARGEFAKDLPGLIRPKLDWRSPTAAPASSSVDPPARYAPNPTE
jgi:lipopolysaccharide transport system ATP-binding protein